ncbi:hypothetical protein FRC11_008935 [Ceratobasidium sp. 423]|nr:hypothetical protein FRC11_008935 [Ceratobasidium sp. 423]
MIDPVAKFTKEENTFLETYLEENKRITESGPKKHIIVRGVKKPQINHFVDRVTKEFIKRFPYRHPDADKSSIPPNLADKQYKPEDWPDVFTSRLLSRFNQLKRQERDRLSKAEAGSVDEEDQIQEGENSEDIDEDVDYDREADITEVESNTERSEDNWEGTDRNEGTQDESVANMTTADSKAPAERPAATMSPSEPSPSDPAYAFIPSNRTMKAWEITLGLLERIRKRNWTECSKEELSRRQDCVPDIMYDIIDLLAYTTGVEIYATGVMVPDGQPTNFE